MNTILFVLNESVVACITDFGSSDYYAGALRGVLSNLLPGVSIVDITHEIPAGDIRRAAMVLWEVQPSFPKKTVFLVVVDPEVGSSRRPAIFRFPGFDVVCPDNGIATFLMERFPEFQALEINPQMDMNRQISKTFHGRDIFAPAAAQLIQAENPREFGSILTCPVRIPLPVLQGGEARGWEGEILYTDHFGNAVTSIGQISFDFQVIKPWVNTGAQSGRIPKGVKVFLEDKSVVPVGHSYVEVKDSPAFIALVGGNGLLEIARWKSPAGDSPALQPGARVRLTSPA